MRERSSRPGRLYAAIPNDAMRDKSISMEARGLLALLMTYSDEWVFTRDHLTSVAGWGKDKFGKVMGELIERGYVERVYTRDEKGQLLGKTWVIKDQVSDVRELPTSDSTDVRENRRPEKPMSGESAPIRITKDQEDQYERNTHGETDLFSEIETIAPRPTVVAEKRKTEEDFDRFWRAFPAGRKTDKPKAAAIFGQIVAGRHKLIPKTDAETIIAGAERYAATNPDPQYVPIPKTWLNGARWEDVPAAPPPTHHGGHRLRQNWGEVLR